MYPPAKGLTVGELCGLLSSPDQHERAEAARQLVNKGRDAIGALPALLALHNDGYWAVRVQVARAILALCPRNERVVQILSELARDENEGVRGYAREAEEVIQGR